MIHLRSLLFSTGMLVSMIFFSLTGIILFLLFVPFSIRYRVTTRLVNRHAEAVRIEIEERFPGRGFDLKITGAERVPGGYRLALDLAPGGRWTYVYEVTLRYR